MPEWLAWVAVGCVVLVGAGIGAYWIWARRTSRPAYTIRGMKVFHQNWSKGDTTKPLPTSAQLDQYLEQSLARTKTALRALGIAQPDVSLVNTRLLWMTGTRCAKGKGGIFAPSPEGKSFYFEEPTARAGDPDRGHHWYAGLRDRNTFKVAWCDNLGNSTVAHEIGHYLLEKNGRDCDGTHRLYPLFWKTVG